MYQKHILSFVIFFIVSLVVSVLLFNLITIQRSVIIVNIQNESFDTNNQIGFQRVNLGDSLFNQFSKGNYRLYIEAESLIKNENTYTYINSNVGSGFMVISDIKFPKQNDTWKIKFELKDPKNEVLDQECYKLDFIVEDKEMEIGKEETNC